MVEELVLENGLKLYCLNKQEAESIQKEVKSYFKNGIVINPSDTGRLL